jgi:hypothetical protein
MLLAQVDQAGKVIEQSTNIIGQAGVFAVLFVLGLGLVAYAVYKICVFAAPLARDFVTSTTSLHDSLKDRLRDHGETMERIETKIDKGFSCPIK